jgi:DNA-binding GntR family transcriptional regulator
VTPQIDRSQPAYIQVVRAIRQRIIDGDLTDGMPVPSVREVADEWGISRATAEKALSALRAEGLVRSVPGRGTFVSVRELGHAPRDWFLRLRRTGHYYPPDESARILSAELVQAPDYVADALGIEPGAPAIRRHRVTYRGDTPVSVSTSWVSGTLASAAPKLLELESIEQGTPGYIEQVTGRTATRGRDQLGAQAAAASDAQELGVAEGSPVLAGQWWVFDARDNVIEFGEYVTIPGRLSMFEYPLA